MADRGRGQKSNGSLQLKSVGELQLEPVKEGVSSVFQRYTGQAGSVIYHFQTACSEKQPNPPVKACPLLYEYSGGGSAAFDLASLNVYNLGDAAMPGMMASGHRAQEYLAMLQAQAPQIVYQYYESINGFGKVSVSGRKRVSSGECRYEDDEKKVSLGGVGLRFKLPQDRAMRGQRFWRSHSESLLPSFSVALSDLPKTMAKRAFKPEQATNGEVTYLVSWNFDDCLCLPYTEPEPTAEGEPAPDQTVWDRLKNRFNCISAMDMLYQDLAWAESFADMGLRLQANGNVKAYLGAVKKNAIEILKSNSPSIPATWDTSLQMSVDPKECKIHKIEEARELAKQRCLPDIIFDEILAHEKLHVEQCLTDKRFGKKPSVDVHARNETHAYVKGAGMTLEWIRAHCGDAFSDDINRAQTRLEAIRNSEGYKAF